MAAESEVCTPLNDIEPDLAAELREAPLFSQRIGGLARESVKVCDGVCDVCCPCMLPVPDPNIAFWKRRSIVLIFSIVLF